MEESRGGNGQADFEEAAREVAEDSSAEARQGPGVESAPEPEREEIRLPLSEDDAREVVKVCFWPLAHYVDPLWAVTDAEAQKVAPKMQAFLRWFLLKYAPLFALKLTGRFPELVAMLTAMALLTWHKMHIVAVAQGERRKSKAAAPASPVVDAADVFSGPGFQCELCEKVFPSREALAGHLPCNPE